MKRRVLTGLLALAVAAGLRANPPEKSHGSNPSEQALIEIDEQWGKATASGDLEALDRILADDLLAVGPKGEITSKKQLIDEARKGIAVLKDSQYSADEYRVLMLDASTAVMIHRGTYKAKDIYETHRSLHVFAYRKGRWQVVATEQVPIPAN